jgi:hypothetical protein
VKQTARWQIEDPNTVVAKLRHKQVLSIEINR